MAWFNPENQKSQKVAESRKPSATFISLRRNGCEGESRKVAKVADGVSRKKDNYLTVYNIYPQGGEDNQGVSRKSLPPSVDIKRIGLKRPTLPAPPDLVSRAAYPATFATFATFAPQAYSDAGSSVFGGCDFPATFEKELRLSPGAFPRTCEKCESFRLQNGHPHAGKCLAGHYPKETLWATDVRWCRLVPAFVAPGSGYGITLLSSAHHATKH